MPNTCDAKNSMSRICTICTFSSLQQDQHTRVRAMLSQESSSRISARGASRKAAHSREVTQGNRNSEQLDGEMQHITNMYPFVCNAAKKAGLALSGADTACAEVQKRAIDWHATNRATAGACRTHNEDNYRSQHAKQSDAIIRRSLKMKQLFHRSE
jgi:hypothetical protein